MVPKCARRRGPEARSARLVPSEWCGPCNTTGRVPYSAASLAANFCLARNSLLRFLLRVLTSSAPWVWANARAQPRACSVPFVPFSKRTCAARSLRFACCAADRTRVWLNSPRV